MNDFCESVYGSLAASGVVSGRWRTHGEDVAIHLARLTAHDKGEADGTDDLPGSRRETQALMPSGPPWYASLTFL